MPLTRRHGKHVRCKRDGLAECCKNVRLHHVDGMTPAAAIGVIGGIARIVAAHEPRADQIGNRTADIGTAHRQRLFIHRAINQHLIVVHISRQPIRQTLGDPRAQPGPATALLAHGHELRAQPVAQQDTGIASRNERPGLPVCVCHLGDQLKNQKGVAGPRRSRSQRFWSRQIRPML